MDLINYKGEDYPIFQTLQKSRNYTRDELLAAFEILHNADLLMKTTNQKPKMILEKSVINICRKLTKI